MREFSFLAAPPFYPRRVSKSKRKNRSKPSLAIRASVTKRRIRKRVFPDGRVLDVVNTDERVDGNNGVRSSVRGKQTTSPIPPKYADISPDGRRGGKFFNVSVTFANAAVGTRTWGTVVRYYSRDLDVVLCPLRTARRYASRLPARKRRELHGQWEPSPVRDFARLNVVVYGPTNGAVATPDNGGRTRVANATPNGVGTANFTGPRVATNGPVGPARRPLP